MLKNTLTAILALFLVPFGLAQEEGWDYNNPKHGGFQKIPYSPQETPPGMVLVEGGPMKWVAPGGKEERLHVSSFYLSQYEETNGQYLAYLKFLKGVYPISAYKAALPDTTVWRRFGLSRDMASHMMKSYFRSKSTRDFPVVGLNPDQIRKYAEWKTDRLNEVILVREGLFEWDTIHTDPSDVFTTVAYLSNQYHHGEIQGLPDLEPSNPGKRRKDLGERIVRMEDGILLPRFRLPSEKEWRYASLDMGNSQNKYVKTDKPGFKKGFDHTGFYDFLFPPEKPKKKWMVEAYGDSTDKPVQMTAGNNFYIHGLSENVSEIVRHDSVTCYIVGHSWVKPGAPYQATYNETLPDSARYVYTMDFPIYELNSEEVLGPAGFRLAMDRIGSPVNVKRNRRN